MKLLAAALLLLAGPARADDGQELLKTIQAGWTHHRSPGEGYLTWSAVRFVDENGKPETTPYGKRLTLWVEDAALQARSKELMQDQSRRHTTSLGYDPAASDFGLPLFQLNDPMVEESGGVKILTFQSSKLSGYQVRQEIYGDLLYLSRRDHPELLIAARLDRGWAALGDFIKDSKDWNKDKVAVRVIAPDALVIPPVSPITGTLADVTPNADRKPGVCRDLDDADHNLYKSAAYKDMVFPWQHLNRRFLPVEHELFAARAVPPSESALGDAEGHGGVINIINSGATEKRWQEAVDGFANDQRKGLVTYAKALSASLGGSDAPADRFLPEESRFLLCRLRHQGGDAESKFFAQIDALSAANTRGFVAFWRHYVRVTLNEYAAKAAGKNADEMIPLNFEKEKAALKQNVSAASSGMAGVSDWASYRAPAIANPADGATTVVKKPAEAIDTKSPRPPSKNPPEEPEELSPAMRKAMGE